MVDVTLQPLLSVQQLNDFWCDIEEMDNFIHSDSLSQSLYDNACDAYLAYDNTGNLVGFFALNMDILDLDDDDKDDLTHGYSRAETPQFKTDKEFAEFMSQPRFHVVDIAYLAVDKHYQHQGIGSAIMKQIFEKARQMNQDGWFITVDALFLPKKPYSAVEFYEKFNFQRILPAQRGTLRMYRTMR